MILLLFIYDDCSVLFCSVLSIEAKKNIPALLASRNFLVEF